jgi:hypothetical protein
VPRSVPLRSADSDGLLKPGLEYNRRLLVFRVMPERPKTLTEMQEECRRFAAETGCSEVSRILSRVADDLERQARQTESGQTRH